MGFYRFMILLCLTVSFLQDILASTEQGKCHVEEFERQRVVKCQDVSSMNDLSSIPSGFYERIIIEKSNFKTLQKNAFGGAKGKIIEIMQCTIAKIEFGFLGMDDNLYTVEVLRFLKNNISSFPAKYLQTFPNLKQIIFEENELVMNDKSFHFPTSLKYLDFNSNSMKSFPFSTLQTLTSLSHLELSFNCLTAVPSDVIFPETIKVLNLDHNKLSAFPTESLGHLTKLLHIKLDYNYLKTVSSKTVFPPDVRTLSVSFNDITSFPFEALATLRWLKILDLNGNKLKMIPPQVQFPQSLKELYLSQNHLSEFPFYSIQHMTNLELLALDGNQLTWLPGDVQFPENLKMIWLQENQITSIESGTFSTASLLTELLLSRNNITRLQTHAFRLESSRVQGSKLMLNENKISTVESNAFGDENVGSHFNLVSLEANLLRTVSEAAFRRILSRAHTHGKPMRIRLGGNPVTCDCSMAWLLEDGITYGERYTFQVEHLQCHGLGDTVPYWDIGISYFDSCEERNHSVSQTARHSTERMTTQVHAATTCPNPVVMVTAEAKTTRNTGEPSAKTYFPIVFSFIVFCFFTRDTY